MVNRKLGRYLKGSMDFETGRKRRSGLGMRKIRWVQTEPRKRLAL